ncbi:hypothetical protein L3X38_026670 [Prunus dulcis]|uniref:Uncharacterized protein n=1 Tax=Prunus dulcis TaxID=3755 RepID=A0AAD4VMZ1_PRUDU|nr:hypothetical protein L3X38_026670 [Prunus dulcis]
MEPRARSRRIRRSSRVTFFAKDPLCEELSEEVELECNQDPLGDDAIEQPVLEVIEMFMDMFVMEPLEIFIDASLVHGDRKFVARTCVLHSHMYNTGTIRDDFSIYVDVLDEFDFELAYMSTRHRDFEEWFDELVANVAQYVSLASDPLKSESEDEPWVSSEIDSIIRDAMFRKSSENPDAKVEPQWKDEPMVESKAEIVMILSEEKQEPMEEPKIEVILFESSDDESMEDINGELVEE